MIPSWPLVLLFVLFLPWTGEAAGKLPVGSQLINLQGRNIHVHSNASTKNPTLVLLSGPTDHWHSDSAWWSLALQELGKDFHVVAIDRPGWAWSDPVPNPSYRAFADDLHQVMKKLQLKDVIILGFATSNLTLFKYSEDHAADGLVKGMILIDPDVLSPYSIARYQKDALPFKTRLIEYQKMIDEGGRKKRTHDLNTQEKQEIAELVAGTNRKLDWTYFDAVLEQRETIPNQQAMFREIANYGDDLAAYKNKPVPKQIPLIIVDSRFEKSYIAPGTPKQEAEELLAWEKDGQEWYRALVRQVPGSSYVDYPYPNHVRGLFDIKALQEWIALLPRKKS